MQRVHHVSGKLGLVNPVVRAVTARFVFTISDIEFHDEKQGDRRDKQYAEIPAYVLV